MIRKMTPLVKFLLPRPVLALQEKQPSKFLVMPTVSLSLCQKHIIFNTESP